MSAREKELTEIRQLTWRRVAQLFVVLVAISVLVPIALNALFAVVTVVVGGQSVTDAENDLARVIADHALRDLARGAFVAAAVVATIAVIKLRPDLFAREPSVAERTRVTRPAVVIVASLFALAGALSTAFVVAAAWAIAFVPPVSYLMEAYAAATSALADAAAPAMYAVLQGIDAVLGGARRLDPDWLHGVMVIVGAMASLALAAEVAPGRRGVRVGIVRWLVIVPAMLILIVGQATLPPLTAAVTWSVLPLVITAVRLVVPRDTDTRHDALAFAVPFASVPALTALLLLANAAAG